ncbi:MAG: 4Fe-4S dicluster domain-containing protein [Gemmatimonadales bacterium]|nr:4Fe-4S dicluster domain-containing protein [Gemmatimonadales bacterium]
MDRRNFIKNLCVAGVTSAALPSLAEASGKPAETEFMSVLVDTTRCIGCRNCEVACATQNDLPIPKTTRDVFKEERDMTTDQWTVVNKYDTDAGEVFVKKQCMHCNQAACSTACLTQAMYKTEEGPVIWREGKCMGCRFCMVSCPFVVPRFEYYSANPKIQKCILCYDRVIEGEKPACVDACPVDALEFGFRRDMERVAQNRTFEYPGQYIDHIYGQEEVGGTGWMYLSGVPFDQLGFRTDLGRESVPALTQNFLYSVPVVFLLWPAFLNGMRYIKTNEDDEHTDKTHNDVASVETGRGPGEES